MGVVYRAIDSRLGRDVAIKLLPRRVGDKSPERERLRIEARAAASLNHPNIATIYSIEESDEGVFIVMEYVEGRELREVIANETLSEQEVVDTAIQIAEGLQAAHRKGVVHRDIKPSNIMIKGDGTVKIMDFGLARIGAGADLTQSGTTIGTVAYMSPEQVRAETLDHRTDIWSFGVLLYEMLTGKRPFTGDYDQAVLYAILNADLAPLADQLGEAAALGKVVARALEKSRESRYPDMREVVSDLALAKSDVSSDSRSETSLSGSTKAPPGLAVLPFASIKKDPDTEFLGFALADQIIGALAYVTGVVVRPSSSVRKYQHQSVDAPTAGRELHVEFVLTGYYLKDGDTIRVNMELVEVQSDEMVWRESLTVSYDTVFELQDIASDKVLKGLKVRFSDREKDRIQADVPRDPMAYEYYLRAVACPLNLEDSRLAIKMLEQCVALDPNYAPAYTELGYRIDLVAADAMLGVAEHQKAEAAFRKALSLNENLLSALWHLSFQYTNVGKSAEAAEFIARMFRVSPGNAMAHFARGYLYRYTGLLEEAKRDIEKALDLDPKNPRFRSAGFTYVYLGEYRKAYEVFDLDRDGTLGIAWKGMSLFLMGETGRAIEYLDRAAKMDPNGYIGMRHAGISAYIKGDAEEGLRIIRELEEANPFDSDSEHWYLIGNAFGLMGDTASCLRALERAVEGGFFSYPCLVRDPQLDSVRGDERFERLLALAKEKHEAFRQKISGKLEGPASEPLSSSAPKVNRPRSPVTATRAATVPEVSYCQTQDGVSIAYAVHGSGPVLVRVLGWFTHLEMEWEWPALRTMWEDIGENHTVVRYDGRGTGLSGAWTQDFTEESRQLDLDAVISAVEAQRVALYGISEGGWTAAHYAARHPERVSHLIVYGSYARGASARQGFDPEEMEAMLTLMRKGWGRDTAEIRTMFTTKYFGADADPGLVAHFNAMQRAATDGDGAARYERSLQYRGDATEVYARLRVPTLAIHCRDDRIIPFDEGQRIAATVPGAKLLPLPTQTHYFPIDDEVTERIVEAIRRFTAG